MRTSERNPELLKLADDLRENNLDDAGLRQLEQLVADDPKAMRFLAGYRLLEFQLEAEFGRFEQEDSHSSFDPNRQSVEPALSSSEKSKRGGLKVWISLASAAAIVLALNLWYFTPRNAPVDHVDQVVQVAQIDKTVNCRWSKETGPIEAGQQFSANTTLTLETGMVQISFDSGAHVIVEGPAKFELLSSSSARLVEGKLSAMVPEQAKGFTILTPDFTVVDQGTNFGILVETSGATEVHVFEGQVELSVTHESAETKPMTLVTNEAVKIEADSKEFTKIPTRLKLFVQGLPEGSRIRSASEPSWTNGAIVAFDFEGDGDQVINRAPPSLFGKTDSSEENGNFIRSATVKESAWGKALFLDNNVIDNQHGKSESDYLALAHSESLNIKGPMSIAFWVNPEKWMKESGLCTKGYGEGGESWGLDLYGNKIRFYRWPTSGSYVKVDSKKPVTQGKWLHVVAVDDGTHLNLYIDGKLEDRQKFPKDARLNTSPVTFGCRQSHKGTEFNRPVRGMMDEIAIWNRALKAEEAKALYNYSKSGNSYVKTIETGEANQSTSKN